MILTSLQFLLFLAFSLTLYFVLPRRFQYIYLLIIGVVFYCLSATPWTIVYLLAGVGITYAGTLLYECTGKKWIVYTAVLANVMFLVMLKYLNLLGTTAARFASLFSIDLGYTEVNWLAPLGLSFYTLQLIGYILDCYWGSIQPEHNFLKVALFASYFPQLTSGPIVRFEQVKDQLFEQHRPCYQRIVYGLWRILWGFFKKIVIANNLAGFVDFEYMVPFMYQGLNIWIATAAFCLQLYADFSGCMDIILGASECFGIVLPENFNVPFFSRTIQEFWRRWHITLGAWLRDYIMNPILKSDLSYNLKQFCVKHLGKKKGKKIHVYFAMLVLWMAMGIWHGSSWKYAIGEGLWFWLLIVLGQCLEPVGKKIVKFLHIPTESFGWHVFQSVRTFCCFMVGMVFFRAVNTPIAWQILQMGFSNWQDGVTVLTYFTSGMRVVLLVGMGILLVVDTMKYRGISVRDWLAKRNIIVRWGIVYMIGLFTILQAIAQIGIETGAFIYGQF